MNIYNAKKTDGSISGCFGPMFDTDVADVIAKLIIEYRSVHLFSAKMNDFPMIVVHDDFYELGCDLNTFVRVTLKYENYSFDYYFKSEYLNNLDANPYSLSWSIKGDFLMTLTEHDKYTDKKEMENQEFDTTEHDDAIDDARVLSDEAFKIIHDCKEIETQIRAVAMVVGKMTEVIFKQSPFIMPHYQYLEEAIMEESVYGKIRAGLTVEGYEDLKPEDAV